MGQAKSYVGIGYQFNKKLDALVGYLVQYVTARAATFSTTSPGMGPCPVSPRSSSPWLHPATTSCRGSAPARGQAAQWHSKAAARRSLAGRTNRVRKAPQAAFFRTPTMRSNTTAPTVAVTMAPISP